MYEFDAVSVSTYEAASLAAKLTEKSADGWEVVAIVPAGSDVTAYLKKASGAASSPAGDTAASTPAAAATATEVAATTTTSEPAGWGSAPANASTPPTTTSSWGSGAATAQPAQQPASTPSVPAGWYHDPAGRFELRYWDGSAWTEHVSRAGQQYTDPPVA